MDQDYLFSTTKCINDLSHYTYRTVSNRYNIFLSTNVFYCVFVLL